jgi:hypothetical protein
MYIHKKSSKSTLSAEKTMLSWPFWHPAKTKFSAGLPWVMGPAELIKKLTQLSSTLTFPKKK